jgi:UDP-N-acetylmuramate--alanine ligase
VKRHVHFVGIGGAGLSAIARVLHERGDIVTGSDLRRSIYVTELEASGIPVRIGHRKENVEGADLVVVSSAVPEDNPELEAAGDEGIQTVRRVDLLGDLTAGKRTIAVAGTHGKTTTSAMIAWMMTRAGLAPGFILGGWVDDLGGNGHAGEGEFFVIEADEYDGAFLGLNPEIAVVTNVEHDHPDCYPTQADYVRAFREFAHRVTRRLVVCSDDAGASALLPEAPSGITYGRSIGADWRADDIETTPKGGMTFSVSHRGGRVGRFEIALPGTHNVLNSLALLAVMAELGVPLDLVGDMLPAFQPVGRRFQVLGSVGGVTVVDDYAHHPTEIRATLRAARGRYGAVPLWAVFQPHTYSRTQALLADLAGAFSDADEVIVLEIYAARESPQPGVDGRRVAETIAHPNVRFISGIEKATAYLVQHVEPPCVVITLSAGDGNEVGKRLLAHLEQKQGG